MADNRNSAEFAFTHFDASPSGWPAAWAWFVGLLQGAYVLTGYGMVASLCEEVKQPQKSVPKAMGMTVSSSLFDALLMPIQCFLYLQLQSLE
jgi:amino acid transporter